MSHPNADGNAGDDQTPAIATVTVNVEPSKDAASPAPADSSPRALPPVMRDKILFVVGVGNAVLHASFATSPPLHGMMPYLYTAMYVLLLSWRFHTYKQAKFHLFMLDFCYWANALLMFYLWVMPGSAELFCVVFGLCTGPLLFAAVVWRNSVVFHDVDKMTSCFLHLSPAVTCHVIRHGDGRADDIWYTDFEVCPSALRCDDISKGWNGDLFLLLLAFPLVVWVAWCVLYVLVVNVLPCTKHWRDDKNYATSYRWIAARPGSMLYEFVTLCGQQPARKAVSFGLLNFLFHFVSLTPDTVLYKLQWVSAGSICFAGLLTAWNGANYYFTVFSKRSNKTQDSDASKTAGDSDA